MNAVRWTSPKLYSNLRSHQFHKEFQYCWIFHLLDQYLDVDREPSEKSDASEFVY